MSARVLILSLFALAGCASQTTATRPPEALYLAVEVREHGETVARPHVVGFEGRDIQVQHPKYRLLLSPKEEGQGYGLSLDLELPSGHRLGHVGLLHGEERRVTLDDGVELKVLLMRVDSPEFRALIERSPKAGQTTI
jgi:hypothetical protein